MYTQDPNQSQHQAPQYGNQGPQNGGDMGQMGGGQQQQNQNQNQNFFKSEQADMMMNYGLQQGGAIFKQQQEKYMPGISGFWSSLKVYFAVNNQYVVKKLKMVLYPFGVKRATDWGRKPAEDGGYDQSTDTRSKWALPKDDTCAPDLYIPLMSFVTYILLFGFITGMHEDNEDPLIVSTQFSPDLLIQTVWRCMIVQLVEVAVIMLGLSTINGSLSTLDVVSYTGYKYVGLCAGVCTRIFGSTINTLFLLYTSGMLAYFFLKSMVAIVPPGDASTAVTSMPRHWVLLGLSGIQFVVAVGLGWF